MILVCVSIVRTNTYTLCCCDVAGRMPGSSYTPPSQHSVSPFYYPPIPAGIDSSLNHCNLPKPPTNDVTNEPLDLSTKRDNRAVTSPPPALDLSSGVGATAGRDGVSPLLAGKSALVRYMERAGLMAATPTPPPHGHTARSTPPQPSVPGSPTVNSMPAHSNTPPACLSNGLFPGNLRLSLLYFGCLVFAFYSQCLKGSVSVFV